MANSTDPFAESVHGTNPQYLVEKITRLKIYNCRYWKESCFGLTSETIVDKAISLKYCGGTYGGSNKPSDFICLVLKLLQLQPELDIAIEFIRNEDFKYLRVLGAFYIRLVAKPEEIFRHLEPLYEDFRKIAYRGMAGWSCKYMDEFIDSLLVEELVCDIALPHLPKRMKLEQLGILQERTSVLDSELFNGDDKESTANIVVNAARVLKSTALDSMAPKKNEEKGNINADITTGQEEYINEYRKDDVRSRRAALQDNEDADHRKRETDRVDRRRENSSNRRGDRRNRSREPRSRDRDDAGKNRSSIAGRDGDCGDDSQKSGLRTASRSPETAKLARKHDSSHSRSRERKGYGDRESRHYSTRDRERSRSYDRRRRSRSRSTGRSRKSDNKRDDRNAGGSRYKVKDRSYEREDNRGGRRRRERSSSNDGRSDRRSRGSRYRSRSRSYNEGRRRSRASPKRRSDNRSRRSRSSSTSSSNSRSSSSSSESERETAKSSALVSSSKKQEEQDDSDTEGSKIISSAADERAAAAKAAKAEKKFDRMFKTKKSDNGESKAPSGNGVKAHPEGSVEYWNQIREGLGIKKLKE